MLFFVSDVCRVIDTLHTDNNITVIIFVCDEQDTFFRSILKIQDNDSIFKIVFEDTFLKKLFHLLIHLCFCTFYRAVVPLAMFYIYKLLVDQGFLTLLWISAINGNSR